MPSGIKNAAEFLHRSLPGNPPVEFVPFRDMLYGLYEVFSAEGERYDKPPKTGGLGHGASLATAAPFLEYVIGVLINFGYMGELGEDALTVADEGALRQCVGAQRGFLRKRLSTPKLAECLDFLERFGFAFNRFKGGIAAEYPKRPDALYGMRELARAHMELGGKSDYYIFHKCEFRVLFPEPPSVKELLDDFLRNMPKEAREYAVLLHEMYLSKGFKCKVKTHFLGRFFEYSRGGKPVFEFASLPDAGDLMFIKVKNIEEPELSGFPEEMRARLKRGYGCEKKRFGEPCAKGCHGYAFPMDKGIGGLDEWLKNLIK